MTKRRSRGPKGIAESEFANGAIDAIERASRAISPALDASKAVARSHRSMSPTHQMAQGAVAAVERINRSFMPMLPTLNIVDEISLGMSHIAPSYQLPPLGTQFDSWHVRMAAKGVFGFQDALRAFEPPASFAAHAGITKAYESPYASVMSGPLFDAVRRQSQVASVMGGPTGRNSCR